MITSSSNPRMKQIVQLNKKSKTRYEQRVFVVEGIKMCLEAPKDQIQQMYVSESFLAEEENRRRIENYSYETVADSVFSHISDTKHPQGILCLVQMPEYELEDLLGVRPHLLVLENIQDPGNLGTMIRAGEGAGLTGIVMDKTTVDIFNPKTIRSTMGSLFRVPFCVTEDLQRTVSELRESGIVMYAACLDGENMYDEPDYTLPCGFLIGNEANGLSAEMAALADSQIRIPMEGRVESLNAAVASALLMYEASRQRRQKG